MIKVAQLQYITAMPIPTSLNSLVPTVDVHLRINKPNEQTILKPTLYYPLSCLQIPHVTSNALNHRPQVCVSSLILPTFFLGVSAMTKLNYSFAKLFHLSTAVCALFWLLPSDCPFNSLLPTCWGKKKPRH